MFIKIRNSPDRAGDISFTIIDNVDVINYFSPAPKEITTTEEAKKLWDSVIMMHYDGHVLDNEWLYLINEGKADEEELPSKKNPYRYNVLNFRRKDTDGEDDTQWIFDTVAYIMSDDGKTIDKVSAGGLQSIHRGYFISGDKIHVSN